MAMSRKHYREAADAIKSILPTPERAKTVGGKARTEAAQEMAERLAGMFKADNSRFDRYTFYRACGLSD